MTREGFVRIHVVMPKELVEQIDALVGKRRRSEFIVEAVREALDRRKRAELGRRLAGSLADVDIPGWESSESAAEWVRALRYDQGTIVPGPEPTDR